jgi:hypothetical protein
VPSSFVSYMIGFFYVQAAWGLVLLAGVYFILSASMRANGQAFQVRQLPNWLKMLFYSSLLLLLVFACFREAQGTYQLMRASTTRSIVNKVAPSSRQIKDVKDVKKGNDNRKSGASIVSVEEANLTTDDPKSKVSKGEGNLNPADDIKNGVQPGLPTGAKSLDSLPKQTQKTLGELANIVEKSIAEGEGQLEAIEKKIRSIPTRSGSLPTLNEGSDMWYILFIKELALRQVIGAAKINSLVKKLAIDLSSLFQQEIVCSMINTRGMEYCIKLDQLHEKEDSDRVPSLWRRAHEEYFPGAKVEVVDTTTFLRHMSKQKDSGADFLTQLFENRKFVQWISKKLS